ncbi:MAG: GldG family protein [Chromatiales bacterium]|jgi:ABC-type uncharacterized transport system involved in gliding motility auxiliary subunit|nr:GldG family protein [Chromatiales bacterium]
MKVTRGTKFALRLHDVLFALLLAAAVGLLGWLATHYAHESDWTASGRNTLSEASVKLLEELHGDLTIVAYAREEPLLRKRISGLVERYQRHKPDLHLTFVDPDVEPQRVRELGITMDGEMVIEYQDRSERLRELSESALSNALQRVARGGKHRLLFLAGHGERDPEGSASYDLSSWAKQLQAQGIEVERFNLLEQAGRALPKDAVLVIASAQIPLLPAEVERIVKYVDGGGRLLWLRDPDASPGLDALAHRLGVTWESGVIVDPAVSQVGMMLFGTNDPRMALVASYPAHEITRDFDYNTLFPVAGAISYERSDEWTATALLNSLSSAWLERNETQGTISYDEGQDLPGPLVIGAALTRNVTQAEGGGSAVQRVLLVADGDFLSNSFLGLAGNLQLGLNMANWLSGDDHLIAIPARITPDATLQLSPIAMGAIGFGFLMVLPLLFLVSGFIIWFGRRRR